MNLGRRRIVAIFTALLSALVLLVAYVLFWMTSLDLSPSVKLRAAIPSPDGSHVVELNLVESWAGDPDTSFARLVSVNAGRKIDCGVVYSVRHDSISGAVWTDERHFVIRSKSDTIYIQVTILDGVRIDYEYEPSGQ